MKYFSNLDSIRSHPLPKWYDDCKLGFYSLGTVFRPGVCAEERTARYDRA